MKTVHATKEGATIELTRDEIRLITALGTEVFHGAFRQECEDLWNTVAMPISFKRSGEILHQFYDTLITISELPPSKERQEIDAHYRPFEFGS